MKILNLGTDKGVFVPSAPVARRLVEYGAMTDGYDIIVPDKQPKKNKLSEKVTAYGTGGNNRLSALLKTYRLAKKLFRQNNYDVITVQDPFELSLIGLLLAKKFNCALNIQEHGDFFSTTHWRNENPINFCRYYLGRWLIKRADSVRAVSERIKDTLIKDLQIAEDKIVVVSVYVKTDRPAGGNKPEIFDCLTGKTVFLTMARLVKQKNLPLLVRSFALVVKQSPDAALLIVGRGPEKDKLAKQIKESGLEDKIFLVDWTDSIYDYYNSADVYVLSSNYEGWGMVAIEAASCGLPIVMTDVGCAGEAVKDGESALVVPLDDEKKLADAMKKLIQDADLRRRLGQSAKLAINALPTREGNLALYLKSWQIAKDKKGPQTCKHFWPVLVLLAVVALNVFMRLDFVGFSVNGDAYQYMETAKLFMNQPAESFPSRILKPLGPLGIAWLSPLTGGDLSAAFEAEAIIFYIFLALAVYALFNLFFKDKWLALTGALIYISSYPLLKYGLDLFTESGAQLFWVLAAIGVVRFYKRPNNFNLFLTSLMVVVGMLWKEYSSLGMVFLYLVIFFHPLLPAGEKFKKIFLSTVAVGLPLIAWQVVVYFNYHYSYLDWYKLGISAPSGSEYQPFFVVKSIVGVYLAAWLLVPLGLINWREFTVDQKFLIKCMILPSFMFLLWTGVSSRLYFVLALLLTLLAINGLKKYFHRCPSRAAVVAVIILIDYLWLLTSDGFREFFSRFL
ncbi:MAG: glycosyltransferase [Candidatus Buchananbacteria bacterium]